MTLSSHEAVLRAFLSTTHSAEVNRLLESLGDHADASLDQPIGTLGLFWHPYGNNQSNLSTIGLASKAGRSFTERLTNAMDAVLETRVQPGVALPPNPRVAAKQWFGRPISGPEDGLFRWPYSSLGYDRLIRVIMTSSGKEGAPTLDVVDQGIGLRPAQFPETILSLQGNNKMSKFHLMGAFGQGGASTLAFSDYVLVVSRSKDDPRTIGFTVIKVLALGDLFKEDAYAYLAVRTDKGGISVPSFQLDSALDLHAPIEGIDLPALKVGTLVRHFGYKLPQLDGVLSPSPGNLYHYLHGSLFDPLFPFRLIDVRDPLRPKDELITGSRNRLMKLVVSRDEAPTADESGSDIRHHRPMEYIAPMGGAEPSIGIEYWVVLNYRKRKGEIILRPNSNELYIQKGHPILGSLNGQNQGELTAQLLRELGLSMVARHLVVHLDVSSAPSRVRRELFSTTREGFKEGDVLTDLTNVLAKLLQEDDELYAIERELTEKLAKREAAGANEEVRKQVSRLLMEAGLEVTDAGTAPVPDPDGTDEVSKSPRRKRGRPLRREPLATLPFPAVTRLQIVAPLDRIEIRIGDSETLLIETDADQEFDRRGLLAIRSEADALEVAAKAPLRGGRARWRLRPKADVKPLATGRVVVTLTKLDGSQLSDDIEYLVLPAPEEKTKARKTQVPPFDIIAINPDDNPQEWGNAWPDLADEESVDLLSTVAYKPLRVGGRIVVYYSTVFAPLKEAIERLKADSAGLAELFITNYEIWIGYHAILQDNAKASSREWADEANLELLLEADRERVARMQVKQARKMAEMMQRAMREATAEE